MFEMCLVSMFEKTQRKYESEQKYAYNYVV